MTKEEKYEKALIAVGGFALLGLAVVGLFALKKIPYLSHIALLFCFALSFLILKSFSTFKDPGSAKDWVMIIWTISLVCAAFIFFDDHKGRAIIANIFIRGKVVHETHYVENDEGPGGQYKTSYFLKPANESNEVYVEIIDWAIVIVTLVLPLLMLKFTNSVHKLWKEQKFRDKHPYYKGTIPDLSKWEP